MLGFGPVGALAVADCGFFVVSTVSHNVGLFGDGLFDGWLFGDGVF